MSLEISLSKCTGCGMCAGDCFNRRLEIKDGHAVSRDVACLLCGHCVAICPAGAISIAGKDLPENLTPTPASAQAAGIKVENLLDMIRSRRTIRNFSAQPVEEEKISRIIEAGRLAPTARNLQRNRFIVVSEKREQLNEMLLASLSEEMQKLKDSLKDDERSAPMREWMQIYDGFMQNPNWEDKMFFNAPKVILLVSNNFIDGGIAASYMEMAAVSQGLGMLMSGWTATATNKNKEVRNFLGLADDEYVALGLLIGYPKIRYLRNAPRNPAVVSYL